MPVIVVKVTEALIAQSPARGYGPRIIIAALQTRLVDHVHVFIRECWVFLFHAGARYYIHLPLHIIPYTLGSHPVPLLTPIAFRIELAPQLLRPRGKAPRRPTP